eukprot:1184708-Prorocentrum_minimum.AAC.2
MLLRPLWDGCVAGHTYVLELLLKLVQPGERVRQLLIRLVKRVVLRRPRLRGDDGRNGRDGDDGDGGLSRCGRRRLPSPLHGGGGVADGALEVVHAIRRRGRVCGQRRSGAVAPVGSARRAAVAQSHPSDQRAAPQSRSRAVATPYAASERSIEKSGVSKVEETAEPGAGGGRREGGVFSHPCQPPRRRSRPGRPEWSPYPRPPPP